MRSYFWGMFIRKNKNWGGTISVQIVRKVNPTNKIVKTIGVAKTKRKKELLLLMSRIELERIQPNQFF